MQSLHVPLGPPRLLALSVSAYMRLTVQPCFFSETSLSAICLRVTLKIAARMTVFFAAPVTGSL